MDDKIDPVTQSLGGRIDLFTLFGGRRSGFAAVKRWLGNELHLLGSVALCRVS